LSDVIFMIQIHLQPLKILGGWRRRRASDLQGAATGDQVLNLCPYHIFGDTSSPEVLSYESTFESTFRTEVRKYLYVRSSVLSRKYHRRYSMYKSTKVRRYFRTFESTKVRRYNVCWTYEGIYSDIYCRAIYLRSRTFVASPTCTTRRTALSSVRRYESTFEDRISYFTSTVFLGLSSYLRTTRVGPIYCLSILSIRAIEDRFISDLSICTTVHDYMYRMTSCSNFIYILGLYF
jgi:hypothetical protein